MTNIVIKNLNLLNQKWKSYKEEIIIYCYKNALTNNKISRKKVRAMSFPPFLLAFALATANAMENATDPTDILIERNDIGNKIINIALKKYEGNQKKLELHNMLEENRANGVYFYVASKHEDCAKDHLDYQGKLYVDEVHPKELDDFIKEKGIDTLQWVVGKPVWFITRPYCRHYFKAISTKKALKGDYKVPTTKVGDKYFQTPAEKNAQYYKERLNLLEKAYKLNKSPKLEALIFKTSALLSKWI